MTIPNMLTLEALLEDDGMDCRAGLPEGLRKQLDEARRREQAAKLKERADKLVATLGEYENQMARLRVELREVLDEYARVSETPRPVVTAA